MNNQLQAFLENHPDVFPGELVTKIDIDRGRHSNGVEFFNVDDLTICMGYATAQPEWNDTHREYRIQTAAGSISLSHDVNGVADEDFSPHRIVANHPRSIHGQIGIISKNPQARDRAARDIVEDLILRLEPPYRTATFFGVHTLEQILEVLAAKQATIRASHRAGRLASALALGYNYLNREIPG